MPQATPIILVDGSAIGLEVGVLAVDVHLEVNRVSRARVTFADSFDPGEQQWTLGSSGMLAVGKGLDIKLRDADDAEHSLFKGRILRLTLEARSGEGVLTTEAVAGAQRLTQGRRSAVYENLTDADAIRQIVESAGLSVGSLEAPARAPTHEALVQHDCTDWDFILARADALGLLVTAEEDTISLAPMAMTGSTKARLELGRNAILDCTLELDASGQHPALEAVAWDGASVERAAPATATEPPHEQGAVSPVSLGEALLLADWRLTHLAPITADELQVWADARLARRRLAMVRGRIGLAGAVGYAPLDVIELGGAGEAFDGKALISGVRHRVLPGSWRTDLQLGLSPTTVAELPDLAAPPAAGLLPGPAGLSIGVVAGFAEDPLDEYRVRLLMPTLGDGDGALWARLATPEAGAGRGYFFRPEPGDEVVVGYLAGDPRQPVVLGALYGSKNAPEGDFATLSEENQHKGIVTANGSGLVFRDQEKPATILRTPRGTITIDDDAKTIEVTDTDGNSVLLGSDGIAIKSAKDLTIEANGKITMKGTEVEIA